MQTTSELSARIKQYESHFNQQLINGLPIIARLDGKAFHTFCKRLRKPYDVRLNTLMYKTAKYLAARFNANMAYTQSDEISLHWTAESYIEFAGRINKLNSVMASYSTAYFNKYLSLFIPEKKERTAIFDCRIFNLPNEKEVVNYFMWRERDATKNSISMAAQSEFSHKSLHGLHGNDMQEKLFSERGINWNDYPAFFKRGTYITKRKLSRPFSTTEINKLPLKHEARTNPNLMIERTFYIRDRNRSYVKQCQS